MPRYFTVAEANSTLPLVRRVVADIMSCYPTWRELVGRFELVAAQARPEWGESAEQVRLRGEIEAVARDIAAYLSELEQVGCLFKGFDQGLVDFYGKLDGRDVFWCWKVGEDKIEYWHELEAGFGGRQSVTAVLTPDT
jgi:hypothetical protein